VINERINVGIWGKKIPDKNSSSLGSSMGDPERGLGF